MPKFITFAFVSGLSSLFVNDQMENSSGCSSTVHLQSQYLSKYFICENKPFVEIKNISNPKIIILNLS